METKLFLKGSSIFNKKGYKRYRIPGVVITHKGTMLNYYEARKGFSDWSSIDVILLRKENGEQAFSAPSILVNGTTEKKTANNPLMIVGNDNTIHFIYCFEYSVKELGGGLYYKKSIDDGKTWSAPIDIGSSINIEFANVFCAGTGHGIATKDKLLFAVWYVPKDAGQGLRSHHPARIATVFSEDNGATWKLGESLDNGIKDSNENSIVELSDGTFMLNIRTVKTGYRGKSFSKTGVDGWSKNTLDMALEDPTCQGGTLKYDHAGKQVILFTNCADKQARANLTIKASLDDGKTWAHCLVVDSGNAGYSDLVCDDKGVIHVFYERNFGSKVFETTITIEEILSSN